MDQYRLLGGRPVAVIIRLVVLSIIVGVVLSALNIRPHELIDRLRLLLQRLSELGFSVVYDIFGYFLLGAVVVIPIWLIARLIGLLTRKDEDGRR
ncbi:MAG: DUF6460 domain-containing protein [Hyphomicrobiaceae bacterium]